MKAKRIEIPGSSDFVQLLPFGTPGKPKQFRNLSRYSSSGDPVWTADLPTNVALSDAYVDVALEDGRLFAWSWSCYRVELNIDTGKIETSVFTK